MFLISNFESPYQVHYSLHFIKKCIHYTRSLSTGEMRGNPSLRPLFNRDLHRHKSTKNDFGKERVILCLRKGQEVTLTLTIDGRHATISEILSVNTSKASKALWLFPRFIVHLSLSVRVLPQFTIHSTSTSSNRFLPLCYSQYLLLPKVPPTFYAFKTALSKYSLDISYF